MQRVIGILIALLLLGYGLVRVGVGSALLAQAAGIIDFPELKDAVSEVGTFVEARSSQQLFPFSVAGYFAYIVLMGVVLTWGALAALFRKRVGYHFLVIYLVMHAALFVNFREVNPKLIGLIVQGILVLAMYKLRPPGIGSGHAPT